MSISDLSRPCAATGGFTSKLAAQLACAMLVAASFLISEAGQAKPSLDISESASLNLSGARSINKTSSFSNRFDCSQTSFMVEMLDCPVAGKPQAFVPAGEEFIGIASTYNPNDPKDRFAGRHEPQRASFMTVTAGPRRSAPICAGISAACDTAATTSRCSRWWKAPARR
jgi:hypothetical protein